jgi:hypothetical protein
MDRKLVILSDENISDEELRKVANAACLKLKELGIDTDGVALDFNKEEETG